MTEDIKSHFLKKNVLQLKEFSIKTRTNICQFGQKTNLVFFLN